eukprot:tig00000293_g23869.t1
MAASVNTSDGDKGGEEGTKEEARGERGRAAEGPLDLWGAARRPAQEFETGVMRRSVRGAGVSGASAGVHVGTGAEANCEVERRRDRRRDGARRRLHFRSRSRGADGGETGGALGLGGGFSSGTGPWIARATARACASMWPAKALVFTPHVCVGAHGGELI